MFSCAYGIKCAVSSTHPRNTRFVSTIIRRENAYYKIQLMLIEAVAMLLKCTAAANSCMAKFVAVGCG